MNSSPLTKTKGIVFRKIPYSETSVIADIYTEAAGLMSCIVSGVRKTRARTPASVLQIMSLVDMVVYFNPRRDLHRIKEIKPAYAYRNIPMQVSKNAILLFMAEICAKTIRSHEQNRELFALIAEHLVELDELDDGFQNLHLQFIIRLADALGFSPMNNYQSETPHFDLMGGQFTSHLGDNRYAIEDAHLFSQMIASARGVSAVPEMSRLERNRLLDYLIIYLRLHVEHLKELNSHQVLRALF